MYAGQALVSASCAGGGSFCHAENPLGGPFGAPAGMNFNLSLACTDATSNCNEELSRLADAQSDALEWRYHIMHELEDETMPPGDAGELVLEGARDQAFRMGLAPDSPPLPDIDTAAGQQIVEHWLACGAPVIERSIAPGALSAGDNCTCVGEGCDLVSAAVVGDCYVRADVAPSAGWEAIYTQSIAPNCLGSGCHGDGSTNPPAMGTQQLAYESLVGQDPSASCMTSGRQYVTPGNAEESVLHRVLVGQDCSIAQMPLGRMPLSEGAIQAISEWIDAGAMP